MTRPTKCACGRYIKPLGWASHRRNCTAYQEGLREFVEKALPVKEWPFPKEPTSGVAPTQAPSAPTRLMLEAGKGALWHASCREIEPTDDEIAAVWKAMEQARTDGVTVDRHQTFSQQTPAAGKAGA